MSDNNDSPANSQAPQVIYAYPPGYNPQDEGKLDLRDLWKALWRGKWVIAAITGIFAVGSVALALYLQDVYRSGAVLAPSEEAQGGGLSNMMGQLGGLASLAGINLQSSERGNQVAIALEIMQSRNFISNFVEKHQILPELMAVERWDRNTNTLTYDAELYDSSRGVWVREVSPPRSATPSAWEAYNEFMEIMVVAQDADTGFVSVSIEHKSPYIAEEWVRLIVQEINVVMKEKDVREAQQSVEYLNKQLNEVVLAEMRTAFYQLIEEQIKTMMLAEVREEYVFSTINPPVVPEEEARPKRALLCILGTLLGLILGIAFVLVRFIARDPESRPA